MTRFTTNRRLVLAGAAAALLPMRQVLAQVGGGDWFAMVQAHHAEIAHSFEELLASSGSTYLAREELVRKITFQLGAHAFAEEMTIYPAIALTGGMPDSDKLYLDQAHAKVMDAQLEMQARLKDKGKWLEAARLLQSAVLRHAKEDEEARIFPVLRSKLDPAANAALATNYKRYFDSVSLVRLQV